MWDGKGLVEAFWTFVVIVCLIFGGIGFGIAKLFF